MEALIVGEQEEKEYGKYLYTVSERKKKGFDFEL